MLGGKGRFSGIFRGREGSGGGSFPEGVWFWGGGGARPTTEGAGGGWVGFGAKFEFWRRGGDFFGKFFRNFLFFG